LLVQTQGEQRVRGGAAGADGGRDELRVVREQPCYAAVRATDPLAARSAVSRADFRRDASIRLPPGLDAGWSRHWQPVASAAGPAVRSVDECLHAVLWEAAQALVPEQVAVGHRVPGISYVPVRDVPDARLVLASRRAARSAVVTAYLDAFCAQFAG
jgi:hypothetical protein